MGLVPPITREEGKIKILLSYCSSGLGLINWNYVVLINQLFFNEGIYVSRISRINYQIKDGRSSLFPSV
jgi:hypothetical protein